MDCVVKKVESVLVSVLVVVVLAMSLLLLTLPLWRYYGDVYNDTCNGSYIEVIALLQRYSQRCL